MKNTLFYLKQHIGLVLIFSIALCVSVFAALDTTYDISTPGGTDNPRDADDRMREIKAAIQERMNDHNGTADEGDHYWPLSGSAVSNTDTGQHRMVTLRQLTDNPSTLTSYATTTDFGFLYQKNVEDTLDAADNGELFWEDEADNVLQLTLDGLFNLNSGYWNGVFVTPTKDAADTGSVSLSGGGGLDVTRGAGIILYGNDHSVEVNRGKLVLLSGYTTGTTKAVISASNGVISDVADPVVDTDAVNKLYVDDGLGRSLAEVDTAISVSFANPTANVYVDSGTSLALTGVKTGQKIFLKLESNVYFPNGMYSYSYYGKIVKNGTTDLEEYVSPTGINNPLYSYMSVNYVYTCDATDESNGVTFTAEFKTSTSNISAAFYGIRLIATRFPIG